MNSIKDILGAIMTLSKPLLVAIIDEQARQLAENRKELIRLKDELEALRGSMS